MHDAYIGGRSENNTNCVVHDDHDDLGRKNRTTSYNAVLPYSAPVERLCSFAGMLTRPHRRSLSDKTFKELLLLKAND